MSGNEERTLERLKKSVVKFRDERDWERYHSPKNLSISISIEASELLELFQWDNEIEDIEDEELRDEIADIMIYLLYLSDMTGIDLAEAVEKKIEKNEERYPKDGDHI